MHIAPSHAASCTLAVVLAAASGGFRWSARAETGFVDRTVHAGGATYRYQVYLPADYTAKQQWPVILFLHGAGERGDDGLLQTEVGIGSAIRKNRDRFPCIVVLPQCPRNGSWTGAIARQALAALEQSLKEFHGDPQRVYLTGLSMGGFGTWYLAAQNPGRFAAVVPICGWVTFPRADMPPERRSALSAENPFIGSAEPYAAAAARIGKTPVWIFHGDADQAVSVTESRKMYEALKGAGGDVQYTEYPGVPHNSWDRAYAEPELLPWLLSKRLGKSTAGADVLRAGWAVSTEQ